MNSQLTKDNFHDFSIYNIPFGIAEFSNQQYAVCTRIGNYVINLHELYLAGHLKISKAEVLKKNALNDFIALGKAETNQIRNQIQSIFSNPNHSLNNIENAKEPILISSEKVKMILPVKIGDYTDFYSSKDHATNVGMMFRDPANALLPNWKHLPVGYHGRASSITVSGTPFHRPKGQTKTPDAEIPNFGPTKLLDFELEVAFIIGKNNPLGNSINTHQAEEYIFGFVLFNDWSARDIQAWEYVPLGPFLAKNFNSTISPWIVTTEALEAFRVEGEKQDPEVLPYLKFEGKKNYDVQLEVYIKPENGKENIVCKSNFKYMYWNVNQQLAHHTVNGCNLNIGDMMASGTISGPTPDSFGSMLEITWRGSKPIQLNDGSERKFINDGDEVTIRGFAQNNQFRVGFGDCSAIVLQTL